MRTFCKLPKNIPNQTRNPSILITIYIVLRPTHVIQDVKPKTHSVITDNTIVPEGETLNTEETNFEENDPVKNTSMTSSRTSVVWIGISLAGGEIVPYIYMYQRPYGIKLLNVLVTTASVTF